MDNAIRMIREVMDRLFTENRMNGDEMRDAAHKLWLALEEMKHLLPEELR